MPGNETCGSHVKEVSAGQSPGSGHPLPADGTCLITHHQLLLFHQSKPRGKVGGEEGEGEKRGRKGTAGGEGEEGGGKGRKKRRRGRRERKEEKEEREEGKGRRKGVEGGRRGGREKEEGSKKKKEKKVVFKELPNKFLILFKPVLECFTDEDIVSMSLEPPLDLLVEKPQLH